ncbi:MAG: class I SAM-dependent methyltransferase [Usitatibacter sp.]
MNAAHYPGKELEAMSFASNYHRWIVDEFAPYLGERVAEVGAGIGSVSELLLRKPIGHLSAFEPSANMYPQLAQRLRGEPRAAAINGFFGAGQAGEGFDSVAYINVLEHIEDDRAELAHARASLRPGGHLLVFVPALAWLYSDFDRRVGHFRRYAKPQLEQIATLAGFDLVRARYFDLAGILPWYVNFVLLRRAMAAGSVSLYDRLVVPPMRLIASIAAPPIGKNILLIARKGAS